jgi:hypothetical protein
MYFRVNHRSAPPMVRRSSGKATRCESSMDARKLERDWYVAPVEETSSTASREIWFAMAVLFYRRYPHSPHRPRRSTAQSTSYSPCSPHARACRASPMASIPAPNSISLSSRLVQAVRREPRRCSAAVRARRQPARCGRVPSGKDLAGGLAAWITALFVRPSPLSVQVSQFARVYAIHALALWLAMTGVYALVVRPQI